MNKVIYQKSTGKVVNVFSVSMEEVTHYYAKDLIEEREDGSKIYGEEKEIKAYQLKYYDKETIREEKRLEEMPKFFYDDKTCAVADTLENPICNYETHYLIYKDGVFSTKPILTYEQLVEKYIREKYTVSQEFAILRQREEKPEEFTVYYEYAESCKLRAKGDLL